MRILVVDDHEDTARVIAEWLSQSHDVSTASNAREAVRLLSTEPYELVISDYQMPEISGIELVQWLRGHQPHVAVIILTGHGIDLLTKTTTTERRLVIVMLKPVEPSELNHRIEELGVIMANRRKLKESLS